MMLKEISRLLLSRLPKPQIPLSEISFIDAGVVIISIYESIRGSENDRPALFYEREMSAIKQADGSWNVVEDVKLATGNFYGPRHKELYKKLTGEKAVTALNDKIKELRLGWFKNVHTSYSPVNPERLDKSSISIKTALKRLKAGEDFASSYKRPRLKEDRLVDLSVD
jgi:hypothetical protein